MIENAFMNHTMYMYKLAIFLAHHIHVHTYTHSLSIHCAAEQASSDVRTPGDQNQSNISATTISTLTSVTTTASVQRPTQPDQSDGSSNIPRTISKIPVPIKVEVSADLTSSPPPHHDDRREAPISGTVSKTELPKSPTSPRSRGSKMLRPPAISSAATGNTVISSLTGDGGGTMETVEKEATGQLQRESHKTPLKSGYSMYVVK